MSLGVNPLLANAAQLNFASEVTIQNNILNEQTLALPDQQQSVFLSALAYNLTTSSTGTISNINWLQALQSIMFFPTATQTLAYISLGGDTIANAKAFQELLGLWAEGTSVVLKFGNTSVGAAQAISLYNTQTPTTGTYVITTNAAGTSQAGTPLFAAATTKTPRGPIAYVTVTATTQRPASAPTVTPPVTALYITTFSVSIVGYTNA